MLGSYQTHLHSRSLHTKQLKQPHKLIAADKPFKPPLSWKSNSFKLTIAIDFGTDGLGLAYAYNNKIHAHSEYDAKRFASAIKSRNTVLIRQNDNKEGKAVSFGVEARFSYMNIGEECDDFLLFERFKMSLYEHELENTLALESEKKDIDESKQNANKSQENKTDFCDDSQMKKKSPVLRIWETCFVRIEDEYNPYFVVYDNKYTHEPTIRINLVTANIECTIQKRKRFKLCEWIEWKNKLIEYEFECFTEEQANKWRRLIKDIKHKHECKSNAYIIEKNKRKIKNIKKKLKAYGSEKSCDAEYVFVAVLKHIKKMTDKHISEIKKWQVKQNETQWIITVPAIWNDDAKIKMKQWAIKAGLVDKNIKHQCVIVYEPDCAALSIQDEIYRKKKECDSFRNKFMPGEKYILIDAGGGTVDVAVHEILSEYGIKEIFQPSGGKWGSTYIDDEYIYVLSELFGDQITESFRKAEDTFFVWLMLRFQQAKCTFYQDQKSETHPVIIPAKFVRYLEGKLCKKGNGQTLFEIIEKATINGEPGLVRLCEKTEKKSAYALLKKWGLTEYENALKDNGHDVDDWQYLEMDELINDLEFKKSKAKKFMAEVAKMLKSPAPAVGGNSEDDAYYLEIAVKVWKQMFDVVITKIIVHVLTLLKKDALQYNCNYLCLVGGLSCSPYFKKRMSDTFASNTSRYKLQIIVPDKPILSVVKGAALFSITQNYIQARVLKQSYGVEVMWRKSTCLEKNIHRTFIENNKYCEIKDKDHWVEGCFKVLVRRGDEIRSGDFVDYTLSRPPGAMKIKVPVLCSNKENPKTIEDGDVLGEINIQFDNETATNIRIKFYFGEPILAVFVCIQGKEWQEISLKYETIRQNEEKDNIIGMDDEKSMSIDENNSKYRPAAITDEVKTRSGHRSIILLDDELCEKMKTNLENYASDIEKKNKKAKVLPELKQYHVSKAQLLVEWKSKFKDNYFSNLFEILQNILEQKYNDINELELDKCAYNILFDIIMESYDVLQIEYTKYANGEYSRPNVIDKVLMNTYMFYGVFKTSKSKLTLMKRIEYIQKYINDKINKIYTTIQKRYINILTESSRDVVCEFIAKLCEFVWSILHYKYTIYPLDFVFNENDKLYNENIHEKEGVYRGNNIQFCVLPAIMKKKEYHTKAWVVCDNIIETTHSKQVIIDWSYW